MPDILLTTLNARYIHSALGLRYLYANLGALQPQAEIIEFDIRDNLVDIAERLLAESPRIIGIGVYIWNAAAVSQLLGILKSLSPETVIVLGGPEVSHAPCRVDFTAADLLIQGEGEVAFRTVCQRILLEGWIPESATLQAAPVDVAALALPYAFYTDEDVQHRVIYIELSRGCPFCCEFCLSAIDPTVRYFDVAAIMKEIDALWQRGVRKFKFVDRSFNIDIPRVLPVLQYFLEKTPPYLIHFEMVPNAFPEALLTLLRQFPPGTVQLEVGIQTLSPETSQRIGRPLCLDTIATNLRVLEALTAAHLHIDLIMGLPGESAALFGTHLNRLVALTHAEIQLGVLKKLSGTTISRHDADYSMVYSSFPPYEILQNQLIPFAEMQRLKRFARFWDLYYNSGNFRSTLARLWPDGDVFQHFMDFSCWIFKATESTWQFSLNRLAELLFNYLTHEKQQDNIELANQIAADILKVRGRKLPPFLRAYVSEVPEQPKRELNPMRRRQILRS